MQSPWAVIVLLLLSDLASALLDTSRALRERRKRALLVYQPGLNWIQIVMGIGLPIEVQDNSITMGAVVKSYYELPNNVTYYTNPSIDIDQSKDSGRRTKRLVTSAALATAPTRWEIYNTLQNFIRSFGYTDGKSCLLNSICETSKHRFDVRNGGIFVELLHLLLTPSTTMEKLENPFDQDFHTAEHVGGETNKDCQLVYPCEIRFSNIKIILLIPFVPYFIRIKN